MAIKQYFKDRAASTFVRRVARWHEWLNQRCSPYFFLFPSHSPGTITHFSRQPKKRKKKALRKLGDGEGGGQVEERKSDGDDDADGRRVGPKRDLW